MSKAWRAICVASLSWTWLAACKEKKQRENPARPPSQSSAPEKTAAPMPLLTRLALESRSRPASAVRVEDVLDALAGAKLGLARRKQYLAATVRAAYCMGGQTASQIAVAVCEYPNEKAARAGRRYSLERFQRVAPVREIYLNGRTMLSLTRSARTADGDRQVARAAAVFLALRPRR